MQTYTVDQSRTYIEDNIVVYNLQNKGDMIDISNDVKVRLYGINSIFARLSSDSRVYLHSGAEIHAAGTAFESSGSGANITLDVGSRVDARNGFGFNLLGTHNYINNYFGWITAGVANSTSGEAAIASGGWTSIDNHSLIAGWGDAATGIWLRQGGNTITNDYWGEISGTRSAIKIEGSGNQIRNYDKIQGHDAISLSHDGRNEGNKIHNHGNIVSAYGHAILSKGDASDYIENDPHSPGEVFIIGKIDLGGGNDTIINKGDIVGSIFLGAGEDVVINERRISGVIDLGEGYDFYDGSDGTHADLGVEGPGRIYGREGCDTIFGSKGSDFISGGADRDVLSGGGGLDKFVFDAALGGRNIDSINDFHGDDRIFLDHTIFKMPIGTLSRDQLCIGRWAQDAGDRIIYDPETGILSFDADGSKPLFRAVPFAELAVHFTPTADQFIVI
jgi:Ca2+-binding RTX toxin-like protein